MRTSRLLSVLAALTCACGVDDIPTGTVAPAELEAALSKTNELAAGPLLSFLPPIQPNRAPMKGENDETLLNAITIEICKWAESACIGDPIRRITYETPGPERLRLDPQGRSYRARWSTHLDALVTKGLYRLRVLARGNEMGHANIYVVNHHSDKPDEGAIALMIGRSLVIAFWIQRNPDLLGPTIVEQPQSIMVKGDERATFSVLASGSPPLSYQWLRDGIELPGATDAQYVTDPTQRADSGSVYSVRVSNVAGEVLSTAATLAVVGIDVFGLSGARLLVDPSWTDLVGARFKVRVVENSSALKLIFGASRYYAPGSNITYLTEANIYSGGQSYVDNSCATWPLAGSFIPGRASLRVAIPDYNYHYGITTGIGTGIASSNPAEWPVQTYLIDDFPNLYKSDAISQEDVLGRDLTVTLLRGEVLPSAAEYARCGQPLLDQQYRRWSASITGEGMAPVEIRFVMPEAHARYLTSGESLNFYSEFLHTSGAFRVQYWDLAVMRESSGQWHALHGVESGYYDGNGHDFGFRIVDVSGTSRIEFANEPGLEYMLGKRQIEF